MSYENYKNCVEEVKDKNGKVIKYHDVVRTSRGEILLVGFGVNHHPQVLAALLETLNCNTLLNTL